MLFARTDAIPLLPLAYLTQEGAEHMDRIWIGPLVALTLQALLLPAGAKASFLRTHAVDCGIEAHAAVEECGPRMVERTILVPQWVTEKRVVNVTRCRPELRERVVTVYRCVPETRQVTREYTVMVPE